MLLASATTALAAQESAELAASCSGHKFETKVEVTDGGKTRNSKVRLCGEPGQTDAEWVGTLQDAIEKLEANDKMPAEVKGQIVSAINAEIIRLQAATSVRAPLPAPPVAVAATPSLPPPPPPQPSEGAVASLSPRPTVVAPAERTPSIIVAPSVIASAASPAATKPRLTIRCYTPGDRGGAGPCDDMRRETLLTVRADQDLSGGASLRFLRRGDDRGEVALAQMRRGDTVRVKLPASVCSGVASSEVEIQIVARGAGAGAKQLAESLGPYPIRC